MAGGRWPLCVGAQSASQRCDLDAPIFTLRQTVYAMSEGTSSEPSSDQLSTRTLDHPIFRGTDRQKLEGILRMPPRKVATGAVVSLPDGPARLHLVLSGLLRCYRLTSGGHQLLLELIPAGGFDG